MKNEKRKDNWKLVAGVLLALQLLIGIMTVGVLTWVDFIPVVYIVLIALIFLWLLTVVYYLFFSGINRKRVKKEKRKRVLFVKRSVGGVLCLLVCIGCVTASSMLVKAAETIRQVTNRIIVTDTTAVYVQAEDPAKTTLDAKDYTFAITEKYDYEHTAKTIEKINEEVQTSIKTISYDSIFDMVDALFAGEVDAMIMNVAYVDLIESQEEYEDFSGKTKTLFSHDIETVVVQENEGTKPVKSLTTDPFVVYISGSDTRANGLSAKTRSDVNILAVVNPTTKQVLLINTPRDYYVELSNHPGQMDKLTHCGVYGIDCSMKTLAELYDEPVDYYAKVNFRGFETLIDAIGGVTIESEKSFTTFIDGYHIAKGTNQMNGAMALAYARERRAFADGDNARGRHQMQMISAIIRKVSSGTTILTNYSSILASMEGTLATNMSSEEISDLVKMQLTDAASWNVKNFSVSGEGSKKYVYSMPGKLTYVTLQDDTNISYAKLLIDKTMDGVILTDEDMIQPTYTGM